jgi:predicted NBD/HSP70 family sugar kinase
MPERSSTQIERRKHYRRCSVAKARLFLLQEPMNGQPGLTRSRNGANLGHAHLLNQRVILEIVRLHGPISRVDIARLTALTNQTVFNITEGLQQIGFIRDFGRRTAERGQPAKLFEINADAAFSVGLHLERDHITGLLVDFKGAIRSRSYRGWHLATPEQAFKQALDSFRELRQGNKRILGLGIALPGPMDFRNGKVIFSPNFPGWEQVKVQDYFNRSTDLPVVIDNDATAAAIGESWFGTGRAVNSFVYIYVGAGVGGGIIVDGRPYRGFRGGSGELGHLVVDKGKNAKLCGCGKKGCFEAYLSLISLTQCLKEAGVKHRGLPEIVALFSQHNEIVMAWLKTAAGHLAEMIGNLILLFDPEAIVVGGHLPGPLLEFLIGRCAHIIQEKRGVDPVHIPQILQGALQDEAVALGAAVLPMDDLIAPNYDRITRGEHPSLLELWETEN